MKKINFSMLFEDNTFLTIFSVVMAALCWFAIVISQSPDRPHTVYDVSVTINLDAQNLTELGLSAIEGTETKVDVFLRGPRTVVGTLKPEDLQVTASIAGVSEPEIYDLPLTLANQSQLASMNIEVEGFSPSTVRVRFDRLMTRTLEITPVVTGGNTPEGYVSEPARLTPSRVTITGPQADLEKVDRAVVTVQLDDSLTRTHASEYPIQLLDAQGDVLNIDDNHLMPDYEQAQLMIRVLKIKTLPLEVGFLNTPTGFPLDELTVLMEMSADAITLAGPVDIMDSYQEISLGYIDFKTLALNNSLYVFNVDLPSTQFTNMDNVTSVVVEFDTENWGMERLNTTNIQLENAPAEYEVSLLTQSVNNISVVGKQNVLQNLTGSDIVVVVDLSEKEIQTGQYTHPVKISIPTKGMVWATGDYSVIIQVTEKSTSN